MQGNLVAQAGWRLVTSHVLYCTFTVTTWRLCYIPGAAELIDFG